MKAKYYVKVLERVLREFAVQVPRELKLDSTNDYECFSKSCRDS